MKKRNHRRLIEKALLKILKIKLKNNLNFFFLFFNNIIKNNNIIISK